jgi:DNA replication and repair protein RecF
MQFLEASIQRDIILGYTAFGPHRDDIEVRLADQPALERASRGEVRTLVIALKLLETELLSQHFAGSTIQPTLLLDDVLSELDLVHQERVLAGFKDHQVFLTTTDAHALTPGVHTIALG